jgi:uncharacterized protein (TIGR03437 family)
LHAQALQILTDSSLPPASAGVPYAQQIATTGGTCSTIGSASSKLDAGALPPGISVVSSPTTKQWSLQGTPGAAGNYNFTLHLIWTHLRDSPFQPADCVDDAAKAFTLVVQSNQTLLTNRPQIAATWHTSQTPPANDTVQITATGGAAVAFTAQAVTDSGGPWLGVSASGAVTPSVLTVSYLINGLKPGTYTGRILATTDTQATLTIPVTLQVVTDSNVQLQIAPSSLAFSVVSGSADPPSQALKVSVSGANVIFQATVTSAPPNGKWLTVSPTASLTPATINVSVATKDLAVGVYNGVITLGVNGGSQFAVPVTFTVQSAQTVKPVISAGGIISAAGAGKATAPGTWLSIYGTQLSSTTRGWRDSDFVGGRLPTSLDGVSVTINGKSAAVSFVSPLQINVLAPDDTATGLVPVQVKNAIGTSDSVLVLQQTAAPGLFQISAATANYALGTHADGSYLSGPALAQSLPGTPARVGETIVLYGTGFGVTQPPISATSLVPSPLPLRAEDVRIRIGGVDAAIAFAGLVSPGLYQFNVVVPDVPLGDRPVVAELRGLLTQADLLLTVQK